MNTHRGLFLAASLASLIGCGGGGGDDDNSGGGGGGGGSSLPNHTVSATDISTNADRLADLNSFRSDCDGTSLTAVTSANPLIIAAVRHAGWQAIRNAGLSHGEPTSNALFTDNSLSERIRKANGGAHLSSSWAYYEDIASNSGASAITLLWNSVYHRVPMMRHRAWHAGYGDKLLAASDYPSAGISGGNGYATINWHEQTTPATITLSYWPGAGSTNVPKTFLSNQESPDPVSTRNQVGCPIHLIFPESSGTFTSINATLVTGGTTHIPLLALVGNASPSGAAGDVVSITPDTLYLDEGELFLIPVPGGPSASTEMSPNTTYTYSVSVTLNGQSYNVSNISYTTGP